MLNVPIRAAGEAVSAVSRRAFLHRTASIGAASVVAGCVMQVPTAEAEPADPLVALLAEYHRNDTIWWNASDAYEDDDGYNALYVATVKPLFQRLRDNPPAATTQAGAVFALQFVADQEARLANWNASQSVTKAALAYFDARVLA